MERMISYYIIFGTMLLNFFMILIISFFIIFRKTKSEPQKPEKKGEYLPKAKQTILQLEKYIVDFKKKGHTDDEIKMDLLDQGWPINFIDEAFEKFTLGNDE